MVNCSGCHAELAEGSKFCAACGAKVESSGAATFDEERVRKLARKAASDEYEEREAKKKPPEPAPEGKADAIEARGPGRRLPSIFG